MNLTSDVKPALWMLPTAALFVLLVLAGLATHRRGLEADRFAARAQRLELIEGLRIALVTASDAERSAVLAVTDEDSRAFAGKAEAAVAEGRRLRDELSRQLASSGGLGKEEELLARFSSAFDEFRRLDAEILAQAVQNTNLKAYALAYGPAAQEAADVDAALEKLLGRRELPREALLDAARAQAGVLRIQSLLPPHIAEESDARMDALEARMSRADLEIRGALAALSASPQLRAAPELAAAQAGYARYGELRARILQLSRQNTNVRSLSLSLDARRSGAMAACQDALESLRHELLEEPAPRPPVRPR